MTSWDSQGNEIRKTALSFDNPQVNDVGRLVYSHFNNQLQTLGCGNYTLLNYGTTYFNIYRYCNAEGIDLLFVYSVPQWHYLQNMIIAVIVALFSSLIIVGGGIVLGVWFSMKMIKPILNLVSLFESVSNMDLDSIDIATSSLSEVFLLQQHFKYMVNKMRQYRCFIPPHLLAQLDHSQSCTDLKHSSSSKIVTKQSFLSEAKQSSSSSSGVLERGRRRSSGVGSIQSMFKLSLEKRSFTSSAFHINGLDRALDTLESLSDVTSLLHDFFDIVHKTSSQSSSHLENFGGNSITVSWNLTSNVSNHEEKCITFSAVILEKLQNLLSTKWMKYENLYLNFIVASVSQECVSGNVGTIQ